MESDSDSETKSRAILTHPRGRAFKWFYPRFAEGGRLTEEGLNFSEIVAAMKAEFGRSRKPHRAFDGASSLNLWDEGIAGFVHTVNEAYRDACFFSEQCFYLISRSSVVRKDIQDFVVLHAP